MDLYTTVPYARTTTDFKACEPAPRVEDIDSNSVIPGTTIVTETGGIALTGIVIDGKSAKLSETIPPQLIFEAAGATALFGRTDPEVGFQRFGYDLDSTPVKVTGTYDGPGSELILS